MNKPSPRDSKNKYKEIKWDILTKEEREEIDNYRSSSPKFSKSSSDKTS